MLGQFIFKAMSRARVQHTPKNWGHEYTFNLPMMLLKVIIVNDGARTSLQHHDQKHEIHWLLSGSGTLEGTADDELGRPRPSEGYLVTPGMIHRAVGPLMLLEISTKHPRDVVRHEDDYGRIVLCTCGCGQPVNLHKHTGEPNKFVNGHNGRVQDKTYMQSKAYRDLHRGKRNAMWQGNDVSYNRAHGRIDALKGGKKGTCEECKTQRYTEWAFLGPNGEYSLNPDEYRELCVPCHRALDKSKNNEGEASGV